MGVGFRWVGAADNVVEFLLKMAVNVKAMPHGETGLHWCFVWRAVEYPQAAPGARSPPEYQNKTYNATPLGWALYGWGHPPETRTAAIYEVVALLVAAGCNCGAGVACR